MRITFPVLTLCIGGAQRMLAELANGLVARGHEVTLLMPRGAEVKHPVQAKIQWVQGPLMRECDYPVSDVIVSNFYTTVESAHEASQNGKGVHVRLSLCYEPCFLPANNDSFPTYHVTKHVLVLSDWQRQMISLNHGVQGYIVPIGVGPQFKNLQIRGTLAAPLQISAIVRKPEGGFSSHREQNYLMHVLHNIKRSYPDVQVNLFCPPVEFASSPSLQALRDTGEFRFLTPADDKEMCYHYNETDIFVSASSYDAGSLPGLEAMRCGAALIAVYSGGNTEYCRPGVNCLMSLRHEGRLDRDIMRLIEYPSLRRQLAAQGEYDSLSWTWERSVEAFETAIKQIVSSS